MEYSEGGKFDVKISAGSYDEDDDEEVSETAKRPFNDSHEADPVFCHADEEDAHRYLRLPVIKTGEDKDGSGVGVATNYRHVDGQCALCIEEYQVGDQVVWSDLDCPHAFHKECIMQWLSKGKKRCPICRIWFVPGARIEDQKISHGEEWERAVVAYDQQQATEQIDQDDVDLEHANNNNNNNSNSLNNDVETGGERRQQSPEIAPSTTEESDVDVVPTPSRATAITNGPPECLCLRHQTTSET
jgi:hypothetical protein